METAERLTFFQIRSVVSQRHLFHGPGLQGTFLIPFLKLEYLTNHEDSRLRLDTICLPRSDHTRG